jgi:ParB-like chromosome segregation protein Spo0J
MSGRLVYLDLGVIVLSENLDRYNTAATNSAQTADSAPVAVPGQNPEWAASDDYLRESLREVGMREPLLVKKTAAGDWLLVDGYRRVRQIQYLIEHRDLGDSLHPERLPCIEVSESAVPTAIVRTEANEQRQDLPPSLEADRFAYLMKERHATAAEIGKMCGLSAMSIGNYLAINGCISEVKLAIDSGELAMSVGKVFSLLKDKGQQVLLDRTRKLRRPSRDRVWRLARELEREHPEFFKTPTASRMRRSRHLRKAKKGKIIERGHTRTYLQKDLTHAKGELGHLDRQIDSVDDRMAVLAREWVTALASPVVKRYLEANYNDGLAEIEGILRAEGYATHTET